VIATPSSTGAFFPAQNASEKTVQKLHNLKKLSQAQIEKPRT
jgi:hypothetical protein